MISISHWGTFETTAIQHRAPKGFQFADHDATEWTKLHGWIELEPIIVGTKLSAIWQGVKQRMSDVRR